MDWDDLRIFIAISRDGGFLPAARRLRLDHTTVARRLAGLERAVGARLMHRSPRGIRLTEAGEQLLEHAERIETEALAAVERLGGGVQAVHGRVRLATPEAFGTWLAAPAMPEFHARFPHVELELVPELRSVNISKREADIAVTLSRPTRGRLVSEVLTPYRLGLYASRSYLAGRPPIRAASELREHPLVWYIDELIDAPELRYLDQVIAGARPVFRSSSITAQQAAVAAGLGLGVLHRFAAEQDPRLVRVLPDEVSVERTYWLVMHEDMRRLPRVQAVADALRQSVREANLRL